MEAGQLTGFVPAAEAGAALPRRIPLPRRNVLVGLALGLPVSALFLFLAARNLDYDGVLRALRGADVAPASLGVVAMAVVYAIQAERWRWIARRDARLGSRRFLEYVVGAVAVNNVVPGRAGDLLRVHWLARAGRMPHPRALATVVVDRSADVLALVAALLAGYHVASHPDWLRRIDLLALALALGLGAFLVGARVFARRAAGPSSSRIGRSVSSFVEGTAQAVNRRDALVVGALSALAWCAWAGGAWLVASSLGIGISPLEALFVTAILNLGSAIPSSPGFVGTYQWLSVAALGLLSVGRTDAFAFSILMQAVWFVPTSAAGLLLAVQKSASWAASQQGANDVAVEHGR